MCMSDYLLGALIKSSQSLLALTAPSTTQCVPANRNRVSLIFSNGGTGGIWLGLDKNVGQNTGITLPINQRPIFLDFRIHGELVQREWYANCQVSTAVMYWEGIIDNLADEIKRLNIKG